MSNNTVLTRKDLRGAITRYVLTRQMCFNYETMQSAGWVYSMHPCMKKIYGDDEILKQKYRRHFQFFNTQPWFGSLIFGACLAIESTKDPEATETAVNLRTGLMGPFAGLGDAIVFILPMTILGAIAAYNALEGSIIGWVIAQACAVVLWLVFWKLFYVAYDEGVSFVTTRNAQLKNLTEAASILGLTVVGALVASTVKVNISYTFTVGEVSQTVQTLLESIMPKFPSVCVVAAVYWGLGKKWMSSSKMVWIIIILALILAFLGICS